MLRRSAGMRDASQACSSARASPRPGASADRSKQVKAQSSRSRGTKSASGLTPTHPRPEKGALIPVCPAYWWLDRNNAPRPFQDIDHELAFSFDLRVPTAERQGQAEVYVLRLLPAARPAIGPVALAGRSVFDLRSIDRFPDTVHIDNWEAGTGLPILFTALHERRNGCTPGQARLPTATNRSANTGTSNFVWDTRNCRPQFGR